MSKVWLISDTHFNHAKVLTFKRLDGTPVRDFKSVSDMNDCMIARWNERVSEEDIVIHLGDVYFGNPWDYYPIHDRLKGRKKLILGNHDDAIEMVKANLFEEIQLWIRYKKHGLLLSHAPVATSELDAYSAALNVHGHRHEKGSPTGPYKSVCVEMTDYYPVPFTDFIKRKM